MRLLAALLLCLLLTASVLSTACDDSDNQVDATYSRTTIPTASARPSGIGRPAPTPTPDATAPPQTLLIDLESGRSVQLTPPGERSGRVAFSPDGRWLVYYKVHGPPERQTFDLYRIDLAMPERNADLLYERSLFFDFPDAFSSTGDFGFMTMDDDRTRWPAVRRSDGSVHRLANPGHVTSWSPDGRWLTYEEFYQEDADGNEIPIPQYLVDTHTWEERKIGESAACHCDANPRPVWAPDSSKFIYTYLVGGIPDIEAISEVHFPDGQPPVEIERSHEWLDAERYITRADDEASNAYDILAIDFATGTRTALIEDNPRGRSLWMSPAHDLVFAEGKLFDTNGDVVASVPGGYRAWSPDGQYIVTFSNGTSCGRGYRVQTTEGELVGCGPYEPEWSPWEGFDIQNDAFAYGVTTRPEVEFAVNAYVLNFATGELTLVAEDFVAASTCIELSPDSRFLVVGHACGL